VRTSARDRESKTDQRNDGSARSKRTVKKCIYVMASMQTTQLREVRRKCAEKLIMRADPASARYLLSQIINQVKSVEYRAYIIAYDLSIHELQEDEISPHSTAATSKRSA